MSTYLTPSKNKTSVGQPQFKTPMTFSPRLNGDVSRPSPSRVELWKEQLGLIDGENSESEKSGSENEDEDQGDLKEKLEERNKQRDELLSQIKVLMEHNRKYKHWLDHQEVNRWQQLRMVQKIQEAKIAEKDALIRTLERMVETQDNSCDENKENLPQGEAVSHISSPQSSVKSLVKHIERLQAENSQLQEQLTQQSYICTSKSPPNQAHTLKDTQTVCLKVECDDVSEPGDCCNDVLHCPTESVASPPGSPLYQTPGQSPAGQRVQVTTTPVSPDLTTPANLLTSQSIIIERLKADILELQSQVSHLETELATSHKVAQQRLRHLTDEKSLAESEVRKLTAKLVELQARPSEVVHKIRRVESDLSEASLSQLRLSLSHCEADKLQLQEELAGKDTLLQQKESCNVELEAGMRALKRECEGKDKLLKQLEVKLGESSQELSTHRTLLAASNQQHSVALADIEELQNQANSLQCEISVLRENEGLLSHQLTGVTSEKANLESQVSSLMDMTADNVALSKQVSTLTEEKQEVIINMKHANSKLTSLKEQVLHYEQELVLCETQMTEERDSWQLERVNMELRLSAANEARIEELNCQLRVVREGLHRLTASAKGLSQENYILKQQCLNLPAVLQAAINSCMGQVRGALRDVDERCDEMEKRYLKEMMLRKNYHNQLVELRGNIRVFCRLRPRINEDGQGQGSQLVTLPDSLDNSRLTVDYKNRPQVFNMDRVFGADSSQMEVFSEVESLVTSCIDGYNVCIFAYGQTGSGKTYTMEGTSDDPGINQRALQQLFRETESGEGGWSYSITVSMLEIYNETIRDLLCADYGDKLEVKMDSDGGLCVPGLMRIQVSTVDHITQVFAVGEQNRATASTNMNERSSRSHALLCIQVDGENSSNGNRSRGKLNLVDLAGSERVSKSGADGERLKEAKSINKSLSCLGDVIHALRGKQSHVPYRNSRLTYLLQDSLGGDSKTLMIVQASPVEKNVAETMASLNFAQRVRCIELGQATRKVDSCETSSVRGTFTPPPTASSSKTPARRK